VAPLMNRITALNWLLRYSNDSNVADRDKTQVGQRVELPQSSRLEAAPQDLRAVSDNAFQSSQPAASLGDPLAKNLMLAKWGTNTPAESTIGDIFNKVRGNFMYADKGGAGSGAATKALKSPAADLHTPKAKVVADLGTMLKAAMKKAASGKEQDRAAVDEILKKIVDAYGIGQNGVTGLEFDPKLSDYQGATIGASSPRTHITVAASALNSPAVAASTILHESNHVRRNKELADLGIDRDKFGLKAEGIYAALTEIEGYQLEINNARKLGTSTSYVAGAEKEKKKYLHELEMTGAGKDLLALAEKGGFDEAFKKFRQDILTK
jgi:hypothetical protein